MPYDQFMPNGIPIVSTPQQTYGYSGISQLPYATPIDPNPYMIQVDGESSARSKQVAGLRPGIVVPLWDINGQDVYFRSMNQYGQLNPLRKGHIVMDDEPPRRLAAFEAQNEPEKYITHEEKQHLEKRIEELENLVSRLQNSSGDIQKRGAVTDGAV